MLPTAACGQPRRAEPYGCTKTRSACKSVCSAVWNRILVSRQGAAAAARTDSRARKCCRALRAIRDHAYKGRRCAGSSRMLSSAVSSAGSRGVMPTWTSTGAGASTGTAARGGGSNGKRVPRTGWRFVRHLNRLSALAFLQPVRKVSLGAEFPTPFRESILRPGLPTPLPCAGRVEHTERVEPHLGSPFCGARKERDFRSSAGRTGASQFELFRLARANIT